MRRFISLATVALLMTTIVGMLIAGPVAAQAETEHVPINSSFGPSDVVNPCNGEIVQVTGEFTGFSQVVQTPTGQTVTRFHLVSNGTGVGSEGNQYVFHQTFNGQVNGRPPFTDNVSDLLISQGSEDNFMVNLVFHVNEAGEFEFIKVVDAQCRG